MLRCFPSHGRKSDKETQSPVLKIFKDIMKKETTDPEKVNLLKGKQKEKRGRSYSGSTSKTDHVAYDSSSTDRCKNNKQANITVQEIREDGNDSQRSDRSRSTGENRGQSEKKRDDTCSCVSCALKKIVGSECTCVACLLVLFSVSVVVAFLLVFKTMPAEDVTESSGGYGENLVKRMLKEKRQLTESYGYDFTEKNKWDVALVTPVGGYSNIIGSDYAGNSFKRSGVREDVDMGMSEELTNLLDNEKVMEGKNSERLKDFFTKLIETDAQIRKLKQAVNDNYQIQNFKTDRFKRSFRSKQRVKSKVSKNKLNLYAKNDYGKGYLLKGLSDNKNDKRSVTTGYVIRAEEILIHYEPDKKRNFPKCSHDHELKPHEKQLKHPFYKYSQRIDEMLETYKKPEITTEADDVSVVESLKIKSSGVKPKTTTKGHQRSLSYTEDDKGLNYDENTSLTINLDETETKSKDELNDLDYDVEKILSTTSMYDIALTVSTVMNPMDKGVLKSNVHRNKHTGQRKLMQIVEEEDQEKLGYEDFKEVLTEDQEEHDDFDRSMDSREKRIYEERLDASNDLNQIKYNPPNIHNPNWKGPMPLYPDELNAMVKQAALQNLNIRTPVNTKDAKLEREGYENEISDTQYVENYADNKYNNFDRMAQAYSDYGVLNNEKNNINDKDKRTQSNHMSKFNKIFNRDRLFGRLKKGSLGEGFRFEIKPGNTPKEHEEFVDGIQKHIKIIKNAPHGAKKVFAFTRVDNIPIKSNSDTSKTTNTGNSIYFTIRKGSRALKSINMTKEAFALSPADSNITIKNENNNNNTMSGIISFISMMADWFHTLASLSGETKNKEFKESKNSISKSKNKYLEVNHSNEILYPSYDFEMVDNIGHRSRVLMSLNNESTAQDRATLTKLIPKLNETSLLKKAAINSEIDGIVPLALVLANNDSEKDQARSSINDVIKNKTVIKRSSGDDSVFWNDLYDDDEYGVKLDYLDNVRDKHSVHKVKNIIHKSKDWIQGKLSNITRKFKGGLKRKHKSTTRRKSTKTLKNPTKQLNDTVDPCVSAKRRLVRNTDRNFDTDSRNNFATLTAKMKTICQEAARAVQNTRNIEVRENSKEEAAATSLMQRLVGMMSDLVDIQVQQKTCTKLPADLYSFLEWLTAPADNNPQIDDLIGKTSDYATVGDDVARFEKSTGHNFDLLTPLTEDSHQEDRTQCLGTIRAVQDLIQQYEGMSDEDKSKMTGVREYLENQLQYLNYKLNGLDDINLFKLYEKREIPRKRRDIDRRTTKQDKNKFTHIDYDTDNVIVKQMNFKKKLKRNLRDANFKPVEEARRTTTIDLKEAFDKV